MEDQRIFRASGSDSSDLPNLEEAIAMLSSTNANEKKKLATGKRKVLAMVHLTMALGTESFSNKVAKHQLKDQIAAVGLKRKRNDIWMKRKEKPPKLFEQIAAVDNQCSRMAKRFDEEDKIEN
eukprot:15326274-Ditylum_brightwellii.AAC.1